MPPRLQRAEACSDLPNYLYLPVNLMYTFVLLLAVAHARVVQQDDAAAARLLPRLLAERADALQASWGTAAHWANLPCVVWECSSSRR